MTLEEFYSAGDPPTDEESQRPQIGGSHYQGFPIEPIDFIMKNNLDFPTGNVIKYVVRHAQKNGKQDLEKAKWYLEEMINQLYPDN